MHGRAETLLSCLAGDVHLLQTWESLFLKIYRRERRNLLVFRKYLKSVNRVGKTDHSSFVQRRRAVVLLFCALVSVNFPEATQHKLYCWIVSKCSLMSYSRYFVVFLSWIRKQKKKSYLYEQKIVWYQFCNCTKSGLLLKSDCFSSK